MNFLVAAFRISAVLMQSGLQASSCMQTWLAETSYTSVTLVRPRQSSTHYSTHTAVQ